MNLQTLQEKFALKALNAKQVTHFKEQIISIKSYLNFLGGAQNLNHAKNAGKWDGFSSC